jgi:pre-rRNA-processing protein TSR3
LDPFSDKVLNPNDSILAEVGGIVGVDCSWKMAEKTFSKLRLMGLEPRKLPNIVPANPVNSGKIGKLSTAEAIASALMLCGKTKQAEKVMSIFKWGPAFIELNSATWE